MYSNVSKLMTATIQITYLPPHLVDFRLRNRILIDGLTDEAQFFDLDPLDVRFDRLLDDVPCYGHFLRLPKPVNATDGL